MAWRDKLSEMERFQLEMDLETKQYLKGQIDRLTKRAGHHEPSGTVGFTGHVPDADPWLRRDHCHDGHGCHR